MCEAHGQGLQVQPRQPGFPHAMFDDLLRALPGERRFLSPLPRQHGQARIDATVAAPGPHDFAVRCGRFARHACAHLTPQRPSQPAPTFRDDREASPFEGTGWLQDSSDLPNCQELILIGRIGCRAATGMVLRLLRNSVSGVSATGAIYCHRAICRARYRSRADIGSPRSMSAKCPTTDLSNRASTSTGLAAPKAVAGMPLTRQRSPA